MVPNSNVWPSCLPVWNLSMSAFGHVFVALRGGLRICLRCSACEGRVGSGREERSLLLRHNNSSSKLKFSAIQKH